MNEEQRPEWYFAHAQDDLNLRMFEGIFSLDATNIIIVILSSVQFTGHISMTDYQRAC